MTTHAICPGTTDDRRTETCPVVTASGGRAPRLIGDALSDRRVAAGGAVRKVEQEGEVEGVVPNSEGFVEDAVGADALEVDAAV